MNDRLTIRWNRTASKLVGLTIRKAEYMTATEAEEHGWYSRPVVLTLSDGSTIYPSQDDEGNDAGALFGSKVLLPVLAMED